MSTLIHRASRRTALAHQYSTPNDQVYHQAIMMRKTLDVIQALTAVEEEGATSIQQTDTALGVVREFVPVSTPVAG